MKVLFSFASEYTLSMKIVKISIRVLLGILIVLSIIFTLLFGKNMIGQTNTLGKAESYKGIITVWQIDSFEGGTGSRKQFLLKVARSFERENQGVLILVIEHTEQSMLEEIKKQNYPDLISFGAGVEISGFSQLNIATTAGGMVGNKSYAVPWCRGGYCLIANPKLTAEISDDLEFVLVSQAEYTQPLSALYLEGINAKEIVVKSPMDAYVEFVNGKTPYFLATQRDINRLERRQMEVITKPLTKYNDLYQYVAVTASLPEKNYYAQKFIEHLLSESVQKSLKQIGMLSCALSIEYENIHLTRMQELNGFSTVSAFSSAKLLKEMQENSLALLKGNKELEIKIKNMLV